MKRFFICNILFFIFLNSAQSQITISNIEPNPIYTFSKITLTGVGFQNAQKLKINQAVFQSIDFEVFNDNKIVFQLPSNQKNGLNDFSLSNTTFTSNIITKTILGINIVNISDNSLEVDDYVNIEFENSDTVAKVFFGNVQANFEDFIFEDDGSVSVKVPNVNSLGYYPIRIEDLHNTSTQFPFSILGLNKPSITGISKLNLQVGEFITITGKNLENTQSVIFDNTLVNEGTIFQFDDENILVEVPNVSPKQTTIIVYTLRGESNGYMATILPIQPSIISTEPSNPKTGIYLTIIGQNIGNAEYAILGNDTLRGIQRIDKNKIAFFLRNSVAGGSLKLFVNGQFINFNNNIFVDTITPVELELLEPNIVFDNENKKVKVQNLVEDTHIKIYDALGRICWKQTCILNHQEIDLGVFNNGVYLLHVESQNKHKRFKILKN